MGINAENKQLHPLSQILKLFILALIRTISIVPYSDLRNACLSEDWKGTRAKLLHCLELLLSTSRLWQEGKDLKRNPGSLPSLLWQLKAKDEVRDEAPVTAAYCLLWNPDQVTEHRAKSNASLPEIILAVLDPMNVFNSVFDH